MARSYEEYLESQKYNINDATSFLEGDKFESEEQVKEFFNLDRMAEENNKLSENMGFSQQDLDEYSNLVIENRWHCIF